MNPDISNVETPDWIAFGSSWLFFIALCIPLWVRVSGTVTVSYLGSQGGSESFGASWGWVAIIGVLAVWAMWTITLLGVELPFPGAWLYIGGGGFAAFITILMMAIRPAPIDIPAALGVSVNISKIPFVSAFIAIIAAGGIIVGGWMKMQSQGY